MSERQIAPFSSRSETSDPGGAPVRLGIAVSTAGRRALLSAMLAEIAQQSCLPDCVAVCPATQDDFDEAAAADLPFRVMNVVSEKKGICPQRNALLRAMADMDVVLFLDDDFFMAHDYIAQCKAIMGDNPDIVVMTGTVLADGASGAGMTIEEAHHILNDDRISRGDVPVPVRIRPLWSAYGCNMAVRMETVARHDVRFDEIFPLYSWLEDADVSAEMKVYGRCVRVSSCRGVHLGSKKGRVSGVALGYAQVANPVYIWRKGLVENRILCAVATNILMNTVRSLWPEPWVDRRGRLRGNLWAIRDLFTGSLRPDRGPNAHSQWQSLRDVEKKAE